MASPPLRVRKRQEQSAVNGLFQLLQNLGTGRVIALGIVTMGMIAFFAFLITRLTEPNFALLYGDLPLGESGEIVGQLEAEGIPYKLVSSGSRIMVPSDQVNRLRLQLAEQGMPSGGSVGYEVFDDADSLGTTRFVQNINLVRALEGELARTVGSLDRINKARVHLVLPRRELFQRDRNESSASVFLQLSGGSRLAQNQAAAIQHLIAAAVPGLEPESVAIVDDRGNLIASGEGDEDELGTLATRADEFRRSYENQIKGTLEGLLERSVGLGKVRAEVSATINFDRVTSNDEIYDPEGQVVRSTQSIEDETASVESEGAGNVSVGNNVPGGEQGGAGGNQNTTSRVEETVNFEISRTIRNHVQETGRIERLSVAVLVDGTYEVDPDTEERIYSPRDEATLNQIAALARSAIGFDSERGDSIEIINMRFAEPEPIEMPSPPMFGLQKSDYIKIAEILVLAVVAILVILLVLRPLVSRILALQLAAATGVAEAAPGVIMGPQGQPMLPGPEGMAPGQQPGEAGVGAAPGIAGAGGDDVLEDSLIDISKVDGRVAGSAARKIGEIIDKHPDEALGILRNWMSEGAA
jgi:flagellar M-ring protein FliF